MQIGIGLFVYNRPYHTRQVIEGLKRNNIDKVYIFCDGPKPGEAAENIDKTRDLVELIDWCDTKIVMQQYNLGLLPNIVSGIYSMLEENEAVVVLEDDCVPRDDFWYYMSACLNHYRDYKEIMHVNGYQLPIRINRRHRYDIYFTTLPHSWGYGLWRRSWEYFRMNISDAAEYLKKPESKRLTGLIPMVEEGLRRVLAGEDNSYAYRWHYIINRNNGFCVAPYRSLIKNIGFDDTGVHCGASNLYDIDNSLWDKDLFLSNKLRLPDRIVRDKHMDAQTPYFYGKRRRVNCVTNWLKMLLWHPLPEYVKAGIKHRLLGR